MKTFTPTPTDIKRNWHLVDASDQVLGRLATQVSIWLMGKHKTSFATHMDMGDNIVVINAAKVVTTGNKEADKKYYRHSGYPGGLRTTTLDKLRQTKPTEIIKHAVSGMLPKNKLRDRRLLRLHIYAGDTHPYGQHFK